MTVPPRSKSVPLKTIKPTAMTSTLRCLQVLELLAEDPFELSISDLASRLTMPKASVHRLCATLLEANLIAQDAGTRRYFLGSKALWIGSGYLRHSSVYRASFFPMQDLAKQVSGTVQLAVLDGDEVLFIHSIGYTGSPHAFADVGLRRPLHATASGKLFLAAMPSADMERIMTSHHEKCTNKTITSLARMKQELATLRQKNYAVNLEELLPGYCVVAAPILRRDGHVAAAISLTLSSSDFKNGQEQRYAAMVREAAQRISLQLGYYPRPQR